MSLGVELAMGIIQLTGVLIPLLLGMTRYYRNNQNKEDDSAVAAIVLLLFIPLFSAYLQSFRIIDAYGNPHLINAVLSYGVFLVILLVVIPLSLDQKWEAVLFGGMGGAFLWIMI